MPPKFYQKGLRFRCIGCGHCCIDPNGIVCCSDEEAQNMARFLNLTEHDFMEHYLEIHPTGQWQIRSFPDGRCIFLEGQGCSIYPVRPLQCRTYPFWPENLKSAYRWKQVGKECPGIGKGKKVTHQEIQHRVSLLKKHPRLQRNP